MKTVYDFTMKDRLGQDVSLSDYRGRVIARFEPTVDMKDVRNAVETALRA